MPPTCYMFKIRKFVPTGVLRLF